MGFAIPPYLYSHPNVKERIVDRRDAGAAPAAADPTRSWLRAAPAGGAGPALDPRRRAAQLDAAPQPTEAS